MKQSRRTLGMATSLYPHGQKRTHDNTKLDARRKMAKALRSGEIKKQPCLICGHEKSEAHHDDYRKPLDVTWLCRPHHRQRDKEIAGTRKTFKKHKLSKKLKSSLTECTSVVELVQHATNVISKAMDVAGINENQLSIMMQQTRQSTSMQFAGGFRTLKTLAAYAEVLGYEVEIKLRKISLLV